jgi:hypothetical protein
VLIDFADLARLKRISATEGRLVIKSIFQVSQGAFNRLLANKPELDRPSSHFFK